MLPSRLDMFLAAFRPATRGHCPHYESGYGRTKCDRRLHELAEDSAPGANELLFLYSLGELSGNVNSVPRGALVDLQPTHTRHDIARAVLESFGYALRLSLESAQIQPTDKSAYAGGGGTQSKLWTRIVSNLSGLNQIVPERSAGAIGTASSPCGELSPLDSRLRG